MFSSYIIITQRNISKLKVLLVQNKLLKFEIHTLLYEKRVLGMLAIIRTY